MNKYWVFENKSFFRWKILMPGIFRGVNFRAYVLILFYNTCMKLCWTPPLLLSCMLWVPPVGFSPGCLTKFPNWHPHRDCGLKPTPLPSEIFWSPSPPFWFQKPNANDFICKNNYVLQAEVLQAIYKEYTFDEFLDFSNSTFEMNWNVNNLLAEIQNVSGKLKVGYNFWTWFMLI